MTDEPKTETIEIEYRGPTGAEHPVLGLLTPGKHYSVDAGLATFWLAHTPDHWRRPMPLSSAKPRKE